MGTSSNLNTLTQGQPVYTQSALTIGSGSFNAAVGALNENTTYYYVAFMEVYVDGEYKEVYGTVKSFKTLSPLTAITLNKDWLEAPESPASLNGKYLVTTRAEMNGKDTRNYSILYDPSRYASLWTAYVLCSAHRGSGSGGSWVNNPLIPASKQTSCYKAYPSVDGVTYDRGHQIPNADRNGVDEMMAQTYYSTNMTPQLQHGFNGGIWAHLEDAVRSVVAFTDTVYVVTGAAFRKKGGNETIESIVNTRDDKVLPVPNYYWKVLLKVKWNNTGDSVVGASAIGFWLEHRDNYEKGSANYLPYVTTVDQIEAWTGFDFFSNLSTQFQTTAENAADWASFVAY